MSSETTDVYSGPASNGPVPSTVRAKPDEQRDNPGRSSEGDARQRAKPAVQPVSPPDAHHADPGETVVALLYQPKPDHPTTGLPPSAWLM